MKILFEEELNEMKEDILPRDIFQSFIYLYNINHEVDIEAIALMSSSSKEEIVRKLACFICQDPLIFDSCHDLYMGFITNEDYLSGNLIEKYKIANQMNLKYGGYFEKNIQLLKPFIQTIDYKQVCDFLPSLKNDFENHLSVLDRKLLKELSYQNYKLLNYNDYYKMDKDELKAYINTYVTLAEQLPEFKNKIGYTTLHFNKDALYQVLMHQHSIIVQMDNEKRMYDMLFCAMNLINLGLEDEVTLVSCQNTCHQLVEVKNMICPLLPIKIQTSRIHLKDAKCVLIEDGAEIISKIKNKLPKNIRIAFFLSCIDQKMFSSIYHYFLYDYENEGVLERYYINGYLKNDVSMHHRSFMCSEIQNPYTTFHLLSDILCVDIYHPQVLCFQRGNISDLFKDGEVCTTYEKTSCTLNQLMKARQNIAVNAKFKDVVDWIIILWMLEHKKQLIYVDNDDVIQQVYNQFISLGISREDIQILKSNTNIKQNRSLYISRTKKVFPYQIKNLEAIHHLDVPASLSDFYHRASDVIQYMYVFEGSVDAYLAQNLFYEQLFFDTFQTNKNNRYLFYLLFSLSTPNSNIKNTITINRDTYEYLTETFIQNVVPSEKLDGFERGYMRLKRKKQMNRLIDELPIYTYFNQKEQYLFNVGNYRVCLPANCINTNPYLVLKSPSNQSVVYPLKRREKHVDKIEELLMKRSYLYE